MALARSSCPPVGPDGSTLVRLRGVHRFSNLYILYLTVHLPVRQVWQFGTTDASTVEAVDAVHYSGGVKG